MPKTPLSLETLAACPLCGQADAEPVLTQPDGYIPALHLYRCLHCRIIYLNPRLTLDSILAVEGESDVYNFSNKQAEEWVAGPFNRLCSQLESFIKTQNRRMLDIGCNRGLLMESARRRGWQATGVEISPKAAERARRDYGFTVYATLEETPIQPQFDLVTVWHVLEHTLNPVTFLRQAAARLAPGGVLALQVPSFDYVDEFRARNQAVGILCSVHNFYFTQENIQMVLAMSGMQVVHLDNDPQLLRLTAICTLPPAKASRLRQFLRSFHAIAPLRAFCSES
jgi:2-polyprenyl-3-methyl-5-hydroxy-6-metoxy-1,4-benzoquinol methylase